MMGRPQTSLLCYRRASSILEKMNDKFGVAYSLCGQSNALRMQNKMRQALPLMKKRAERRYRSLKLKEVHLGFVLWSQSQAYGVLRQWKTAEQTVQEAAQLFRFQAAHDQRGLFYTPQ